MFHRSALFAIPAAIVICLSGCSTGAPATDRAAITADMRRAADWQIAHPSKRDPRDWALAPYYSGLMAVYRTSGDKRYLDAMLDVGRKNQWAPGKLKYHADDIAVCLSYLEVYRLTKDSAVLAPTVERLDSVLATPPENPGDLDLRRNFKRTLEKWSWCDSLYMAPTVWTSLAEVTGDRKYLDYSDREFWRTHDYLYDKTQHLFYRDSRYLEKKEANGASVFWGRGNGWVMGGIAHILGNLPKDHPSRARYEALMKDMAAKLLTLQHADGSWHASLLDPVTYAQPEMSCTALISFGMAWGVNNGVLDRAVYEPALRRSWECLVSHMDADGRLGMIQPIGEDPRHIKPTDTETYGVGAFLLFGEQLSVMLGETR